MNDSTPSSDVEPSVNAAFSPSASVAQQAFVSAVGEIVGLTVSIGAVYCAEHLAPRQMQSLTQRLARTLGKHAGDSHEQQLAAARKIADFSIMNMGGLMNMSTQFALHRHAQSADERAPLARDLGRVITGRMAGTVTAGLSLLMAEKHLPGGMDKVERRVGQIFGRSARLGELVTSSLVQSAGALPGNVSAQLLYDRLFETKKSRA